MESLSRFAGFVLGSRGCGPARAVTDAWSYLGWRFGMRFTAPVTGLAAFLVHRRTGMSVVPVGAEKHGMNRGITAKVMAAQAVFAVVSGILGCGCQ